MASYFLISFFEHGDAVKIKSESREVRENRVRKTYGRNNVQLETTSFRYGM